ncbi:MAG TPA: nucleotide exchange factor GrpE [Methanosarcinales archaeon]|nr:nucleotide exchange factor GrpE [Methanosarcinales archaeon]
MTDSNNEESGAVGEVENAGATDTIEEAAPEDPLQELKDKLEECEERAAANFDRFQRLQADFANYKKRTAKETIESIEYANEGIILSLLDVIDNLERALESIKREGDVDATRKGIEMILRQFYDLLEKEGVTRIDAEVNQMFDPHLHETIARVACDSESGTIVEVLQCGYKLKSKVIRPSMVKAAE